MSSMRAVAVVGFTAGLLIAGCGSSGGSTNNSHDATKQSAASPSRAAPQLRLLNEKVSIATVQRAIADLDSSHPSIATFSVNDVTYTRQSRTRVLRACFGTNTAATQQAETTKVLACAPLIFFYYQYGKTHHVSQATSVADSIYSYASTQVKGPTDPQSLLEGVLKGWGLPIASAQIRPKATISPADQALINTIRHDILKQRSVRVSITGYGANAQPTEKIVSTIGPRSNSEVLREGSEYAEIRIINGTAYVTGNRDGLRQLLGLPSAAISAMHGHWLRDPAGSAGAKELSAENSLAALPTSILPQTTDAVKVTARRDARAVKTLSWSASSQNGTTIHASLIVQGRKPLPIEETTIAAGNKQVVQFAHWDHPVKVTAPAGAISIQAHSGP